MYVHSAFKLESRRKNTVRAKYIIVFSLLEICKASDPVQGPFHARTPYRVPKSVFGPSCQGQNAPPVDEAEWPPVMRFDVHESSCSNYFRVVMIA